MREKGISRVRMGREEGMLLAGRQGYVMGVWDVVRG